MQVGLFDHIEDAGRPLAILFEERLAFAEAADQAGIYCLHVAEHHCSPINMTPSPSVFLAAAAQRTKRMRLGPLCYLLPLYSPLRVIEEICMLDHLSNGRLEIGVGRGVSPFELNYNNVDHSKSREIFIDSYECIIKGLTNDTLNYEGPFVKYVDAPIALRPLQKPTPAFWYGSSNTTGATWAGEQGMHFTANGPMGFAKGNIDAYKAALAKRGGPQSPKEEFRGGAAIGALRNIVVAKTDDEAARIAKPAAEFHIATLNWLRTRHGVNAQTSRLNVPRALDFKGMVEEGTVIAGSPKTVLHAIRGQTEAMGINYLLAYMFFGAMALSDALASLELFRTQVMPEISRL